MVDKNSQDWPGLSGEMACRIRARDWRTTPLGPIEEWSERLKTVVDLMLCSKRANYIAYGPSLTLIYNSAYVPILGSKHPAALGRPFQEVWAETWARSGSLIAAVMGGDAQYLVDCPFSFADEPEQPIRWFTFTWTPLRDGDGAVMGFYSSFIETTKQVLAQAALRESEERLRFVSERAGIGYWYWDSEAKKLDCTPLCKTLFGVPENDAVNYERFSDAVIPEDRKRVQNLARACVESGAYFDAEYRITSPDGSQKWIHASGGPDKPGGPACFAGIVLDVTAQKEAREALRRSEQRYRQLVEQMTDGLFVTSPLGYYIDVSEAGCAMLGMTRDELLGKHIRDITCAEDHHRLDPAIRRFREDDGVHVSEWRFQRKDGSTFIGEVAGRKLPNGNLQGVLRDITERKRHEEQVQLLVREVNHRAKNMLAIVQAVARQTAAASDPLAFVDRFGERIQALAASQDLLVKAKWTGVKLAELIRAQLASFTDLIGTRIALEGPETVLSPAAAQTLGMTIHELSSNAGKYGALSNGQGRVLVEWDVRCSPEQEAAFEMIWREEGGPPVARPSRRGFGSTVLTDMVEMGLNAKIDLDFKASGFCWRLRCKAADILAEQI